MEHVTGDIVNSSYIYDSSKKDCILRHLSCLDGRSWKCNYQFWHEKKTTNLNRSYIWKVVNHAISDTFLITLAFSNATDVCYILQKLVKILREFECSVTDYTKEI